MCSIDASKAVEALGIKRPVHFKIVHDSSVLAIVREAVVDGGIFEASSRPSDGDHTVIVRPDAIAFLEGQIQHAVAHELFHVAQQESFTTAEEAQVEYKIAGLNPRGNAFELEAEREAGRYEALIEVHGCESVLPTIHKLFPHLETEFSPHE